MGKIITQVLDLTAEPTPDPGNFILALDLDGVLKKKDDAGNIAVIGDGIGAGVNAGTAGYLPKYDTLGTNVEDSPIFATTLGSIGIGTTSPTAKFEILGSDNPFATQSNTVRFSVFLDGAGTTGSYIGTESNDDIRFFVNNSAGDMILDKTGNLGIGAASSGYRLFVTGNVSHPIIANFENSVTDSNIEVHAAATGAASNVNVVSESGQSSINLYSYNTTPGASGGSSATFYLYDGGLITPGQIHYDVADSKFKVESSPDGTNWHLSFGTNGTERMIIQNDGKVGIGTSSLTHLFEVYSSTNNFARLGGSNPIISQTANNFIQFTYNNPGDLYVVSNDYVQRNPTTTKAFSNLSTGEVGLTFPYNVNDYMFLSKHDAITGTNIFAVGHAGFNGDNRIGVSTQAPNALIDINYTGALYSTVDAFRVSTPGAIYGIQSDNNWIQAGTRNAYPMYFLYNNLKYIGLESTGIKLGDVTTPNLLTSTSVKVINNSGNTTTLSLYNATGSTNLDLNNQTGNGSEAVGARIASSLITATATTVSSDLVLSTSNAGTVTEVVRVTNDLKVKYKGTSGFTGSEKVEAQAGTQTTDATATTIATISTSSNEMVIVKGYVSGFRDTYAEAYGANFFAVFYNNGGTLAQVGTSDVNEKHNFSGAPTISLTTSGTNILVQVTGEAAKTVNWTSTYEYQKTQTNA